MKKKSGCPLGMRNQDGKCYPMWTQTSNIGKIDKMMQRLRIMRDKEKSEYIYSTYDVALDKLEDIKNNLIEKKYGQKKGVDI